jgi:hypothetical protein
MTNNEMQHLARMVTENSLNTNTLLRYLLDADLITDSLSDRFSAVDALDSLIARAVELRDDMVK